MATEGSETDRLLRTKEWLSRYTEKRKRGDRTEGGAYSAPVSPANSVILDLTWDDEEGRSIKMRREVVPPGNSQSGQGEGQTGPLLLANSVRKTIKEIDREVRKVAQVVLERNTKKEIKEGSQKLRSLLSQITTLEVNELLQTLGRHGNNPTMIDADQSSADIRDRLGKLEEEVRLLKEANEGLRKENKKLRLETDNKGGRLYDEVAPDDRKKNVGRF